MNLVALAPQWLVLVLVGLLLIAAVEDAIRLRISNLTCLGILAAGLAAMVHAGPERGIWQNVVVLIGLLAVGTAVFAAGKMGGGDIKLLAATGWWFDLQGALLMLSAVLIAGGLLAILVIGLRMARRSLRASDGTGLRKRGRVIPYGVAIAAGAVFSIALARGWA
jgi:prepilin peptidase CpaA